MPKEPGFYFYNGEWKRETSLALVTKAAKGCWMDMLVLLSECPVRGKFAHSDGRPWTREEIATAIGLGAGQTDISENMRCIEELLQRQVCSIDKRGAIFNRRMVRDQKIREKDAARQREFRRNQRVTVGKQTKCVTHDVTLNVTPLSEEEREIEKEIVVSSSQKEKAQAFFLRIQELGFRDSRSVVAQSSYIDRLADHGDTPESILERLSRIYRWTQNGVFAPRLSEVIRRCDEPQELWERKDAEIKRPTAKESFDNFGYYRCDCGYQFLPDGKTECPGCEKPLEPKEAVAGAKGAAVGRKA